MTTDTPRRPGGALSGNGAPAWPAGTKLQRLVDDLGVTLLDVIEAPGPLDDEVTGVTIFDPHDDLLISPGELLLGVGLADEAQLTALIRQLGPLGAAALVVKTPKAASDSLRAAVHEHGVPLLGLTRAASWFDVAILLRSLLDRWAAVRDARLGPTPAGDLFAFANAVSALVDAPVTVEDRSSRVLAFSGRQDEADARRIQTILQRHIPPAQRQLLEERGVLRELYRSRQPVYVPSIDADTLPRVAVAVRAGAEVLGSLWVVVKKPMSAERLQALTDAADLAALHLLHERNAADLSRQLSADLLESVLSAGPAASEAAVRLGLPIGPLCVLACQPLHTEGGTGFEAASQRLADALAVHLNAIRADMAVARIGRFVYAVVSVPGRVSPEEMSRRLHTVAAAFVARLGSREPAVIGIGGPARSLPGLARARAEAERTVRVLRERSQEGRAARFEDVYLEAVLDRLGEVLGSEGEQPRGPVARLLAYDADKGTELAASLHAYLEAFGDIGRAASVMHVHPNTFRYRLRRIREVGEIDLDDPRARLAALVQLTTLQSRP